MSFYWPILLVVGSNVVYHVCAKSMPAALNPFASLLVTYGVGGIFALAIYYGTAEGASLAQAFSQLNWTPFVLGLAIVGLELGNIYMYKLGWAVNTGYMMQSAILAVALLAVGYGLYHETVDLNKCLGILLCLVGMYFLNK